MNIENIQYEPAHAYLILDNKVREQDMWLSAFPDWDKWVEGWKDGGPARTLIIEHQIVCCGGIVLLEWNKGEAWTLFSTLINKYPKSVFRFVRDNLELLIREHELNRVQALINPYSDRSQRFAEHLGFEKEGLLRSFGPNGEDYLMYARIARWQQRYPQ